MSVKENGIVKWFDLGRGFGFITPASGRPDIFVHVSAIIGDGYKILIPGEEVQFEIVDSERGFRAVNVRRENHVDKSANG